MSGKAGLIADELDEEDIRAFEERKRLRTSTLADSEGDKASQAVADAMLRGWTMLGSYCPRYGCHALLREPQGFPRCA